MVTVMIGAAGAWSLRELFETGGAKQDGWCVGFVVLDILAGDARALVIIRYM